VGSSGVQSELWGARQKCITTLQSIVLTQEKQIKLLNRPFNLVYAVHKVSLKVNIPVVSTHGPSCCCESRVNEMTPRPATTVAQEARNNLLTEPQNHSNSN
jgi:hypothetical protein